mmetsp:Transcript_58603/g.79924  ORF Transcript_58603/g.79924 Transcript_58603/m.79924 type:complete len:100 (-) Transcript_58603:78-377(-)
MSRVERIEMHGELAYFGTAGSLVLGHGYLMGIGHFLNVTGNLSITGGMNVTGFRTSQWSRSTIQVAGSIDAAHFELFRYASSPRQVQDQAPAHESSITR